MWTCHELGDRCWSWRCADTISMEASQTILQIYRSWKENLPVGVLDVVPAYTEIAVHFDPSVIDRETVRRTFQDRLEVEGTSASPGSTHVIPVIYEGPDLGRVAQHAGVSVAEVISRHAAVTYQVAMIGFRPHFPYCLGVDPSLRTPRLSSPRKRVAAGSVALAGSQTGVYPEASPGGWNLLGVTNPVLLEPILPGDQIRFHQVKVLP